MKPIDKVSGKGDHESSGRIERERVVASKKSATRRPSPRFQGEGSIDSRNLTDAAVHFGGVEATAR
ncbi:hypothetical protein, partial [Bradyrhizobium australafricanum]|uniref:hypothetical protein n=1 Tax=Bradyrhizobium australafricanum TaxID=2821406 RepID=UPI001CE28004